MNFTAALSAAFFAVFSNLAALHIPAYAAIAIAGMIAALCLSLRTARLRQLEPEALWDAGVFAIAAAFVLSRLLGLALFVIIEHGQLTLSLRDILSFSSISYLSLGVTAIPVILWLRWKRLPLLRAMDAWSPCGTLLWSALSLADFASNSGSGLPTRLPWAMHDSTGTRVHPVALYSAVAAVALCVVLIALLRRIREPGRVAAIALIVSGTILFLLDMLRVPELPLSHNLLEMSQWIALAAIVFGACLLAFVPRTRQQEAR